MAEVQEPLLDKSVKKKPQPAEKKKRGWCAGKDKNDIAVKLNLPPNPLNLRFENEPYPLAD